MRKNLSRERTRAHRTARRTGAALTAMGVLHLVRPGPFERLIPDRLPGTARAWAVGSGYAELATAALLLLPRTRRLGGAAAVALFIGVWPGNVKMAWDRRHEPWQRRVVPLGRLPLQIPLITSAARIARYARG